VAAFPPNDLLLSPWTYVSPLSKLSIAIQAAAAVAGLVPAVRRRLRPVSWFAALLVGPPLLWTLLEVSIGLIFSFEVIGHFDLQVFYGWLLRFGVIIGCTLFMQVILALEYTDEPLRFFPVLGVFLGLLAILSDVLFTLSVITAFSG
jgi:hypothetical protein